MSIDDVGPDEVFQVAMARDVVEASGPDAATFLQGQLSQDVAALPVGGSGYSLLLQPQGKVDAWLRVSRTAEETFLLDVDAGFGAAVVQRLERFKLRTRCTVTQLDGWSCRAVRGHGVERPAVESAVVVADARWPGIDGFDLIGPDVPPLPGVAAADTSRYVQARIAAGVPAMGHELDERTIPAEAGQWLIDVSVSFTKGCYTGQELVARVDSRGSNTPRRLRRLRVDAGAPPPAHQGEHRSLSEGASVIVTSPDDPASSRAVGVVTSAVAGGELALAYVQRSVDVPAAATVDAVAVTIEALS